MHAEHLGFAEMHCIAGLGNGAHSAETRAPSLAEIRDLDLCRNRVLVWTYQCKPGKPGGNIGNRCRNAPVHKSDLLLVFFRQIDHRFYVAWFDHR